MAYDTRFSNKAKDDENNNGRHSGPSASDTKNLRRSGRETSSKIFQGPSNTRRSERLLKRKLPIPAVRRKSKRFEQQKMPSPLRRFGKTKNQSPLTHLDPKSSGSSGSKQKRLKKQKSVKQLALEAKEVQQLPSAKFPFCNQDTTEEMHSTSQQVKVVSSPVDVVPATQSNHDSMVMDSLQHVQQLHSAESPLSNQDTTEEVQNSSQEVELPSSPLDVMPANQSNHESLVMEPLMQVQQLPSLESPSSNQYAGREMLKPFQQVEPVTSPVNVVSSKSNRPHHESQVMEHLEQVQELKSAEHPSSNQNTAEELHNSSQQVQSVSTLVDVIPPSRANCETLFMEPIEHEQLASVEFPSSNQNTAKELQNSSQQVLSVSGLVDVIPSSQANSETVFMEPLEHVQQLASLEFPSSNQYPSNLPMANGIEHQQISEDTVPNHVPQASIEVPHDAVVQLDSLTPGGFRTHLSGTINMSTSSGINNRPIQTATQSASRTPPPLYSDPLKNELEKIRKEADQAVKDHEDMKLQLKSDCEKEIEEIRRKYDIKFREIEVEYQQRKKNLDTIIYLALINKKLAEAVRSKYVDRKVLGASRMQKDASFARRLVQLSGQQSAYRFSLLAGPSSCRPPAASFESSFTLASSQNMVPPMQAAYNTTGIFSSVPTRPPHVNPVCSPSGHPLASGNTRASALCLEPYRSLTNMPTTSLPILLRGIPNQPAPSNTPATSLLFPHLPPRPTPPTYQLDPHNRGY